MFMNILQGGPATCGGLHSRGDIYMVRQPSLHSHGCRCTVGGGDYITVMLWYGCV